MLMKAKKNAFAFRKGLDKDKDRVLREAFGRFRKAATRVEGEDLAKSLYTEGWWVACDCSIEGNRPPLLFPKGSGIVQREKAGHGTAHAEECDFAREADDQKRLVRSYRRSYRPQGGRPAFRLAPRFGADHKHEARATRNVSTNRSRPGLAQMLCELLSGAGLERIGPEESGEWDLNGQIALIRQAAARVEIAEGRTLNGWLALGLGELRDLKERLAQEGDWGDQRPHGIFISSFGEIDAGTLVPTRHDIPAIPVEGTISIFGEGERALRSPYLVVGLVAKADPNAEEPAVVRAYAHPCVAWNRLTLVDSSLERTTLEQLMDCRDWLRGRLGVTMTITKPLFDMGPEEAEDPREICLPDFVLESIGEAVTNRTVVVETMGYATQAYRERKARMRPLFESVGRVEGSPPTPVVEYDPHRWGDQAENRLWREARWAVSDRKTPPRE